MPCLPLLALVGFKLNVNWLEYVTVFVGIPILDLFFGCDDFRNFAEKSTKVGRAYFYLIPHLYVAVWFGVLVWAFSTISGRMKWVDLFFFTIAIGNLSSFATCAAHELLHRTRALDYWMSRFVMVVCGYGHFVIEHPHHHAAVGIVEEGTVPRKGESLYSFIIRNVRFGYTSTARIEHQRIKRKGLSAWMNRAWQQHAASIAIGGAIAAVWGRWAFFLFIAQVVIGSASLEMIQYLEHYGLNRSQGELTSVHHSWNGSGFITNAVTLNIARHSSHHMNHRIPYQHLDNEGSWPQQPGGYFAMAWLAMVPPLWFRVMDCRIPRGGGR